jgi:non-heme chloroperoxidase
MHRPDNSSSARPSSRRRAANGRLRQLAAGVTAALLPLSAAAAQRPAALLGAISAGGAPSVRFAEASLSTGVRLRYAEQGDSTGEPIILLHSYSDSWYSFRQVLPLLSSRYHVFALDQRGHGDSDQPADGYAMRDLAADVIAFMDARGLGRATIVGHSMGSFVAQQAALRAPERVSRLVHVGSTTTPRTIDGMAALQATVDSLDDPVPESFGREFQESTVYQPLPREFMDMVVAESLKLPARVWQSLILGMLATDPADGLRAAAIPTLVLWGDRAVVARRAEQEALVAMIGTATLRVYPETGHALHWERPADFVRDLEAFVRQTASR